jgi:preprotein translocase subunit SecF
MQFFKETKIDFMSKKYLWISVSVLVIIGGIVSLGVKGIDLGIEFVGGTEIQLKFLEAKSVQEIRDELSDQGLGNAQIQQIGDPELHEVLIKIPLMTEQEGNIADQVYHALRKEEYRQKIEQGLIDLNIADKNVIESALLEVSGDNPQRASDIAEALVTYRKEHKGIITEYAEIEALPEFNPEYIDHLKENSFLGNFAERRQEFIGAVVAPELRNKAIRAIIGSLIGMLIYIWIRFQFQWGLAAIVALFHDVLITLGIFSLSGKEFSLPVVAAFLTLVGYSVNDSIVVFDRIRENIRLKVGEDFTKIINLSINQTLSRTIITSLLTWLVVLFLFFMGGEVINPFAFVLFVGVIVGTYSSIYIASPFLIIWKKVFKSKK